MARPTDENTPNRYRFALEARDNIQTLHNAVLFAWWSAIVVGVLALAGAWWFGGPVEAVVFGLIWVAVAVATLCVACLLRPWILMAEHTVDRAIGDEQRHQRVGACLGQLRQQHASAHEQTLAALASLENSLTESRRLGTQVVAQLREAVEGLAELCGCALEPRLAAVAEAIGQRIDAIGQSVAKQETFEENHLPILRKILRGQHEELLREIRELQPTPPAEPPAVNPLPDPPAEKPKRPRKRAATPTTKTDR